jgi:6-phosphogluconolactonase
LTRTDLDWSKVTILLTDERFVPETSERSNARLLRAHLLTGTVAKATFIPYYREHTTPDDLPDVLDPELTPCLPLDVCVLGMGADMHTASIFPGADRLSEALSPDVPHVILPMRAPGAPEPRLTLTAPVLRGAGEIHLLITGPEKLAALEKAQTLNDWQKAPVLAVLDRDHDVHVHYAD